MQNPSGTFSYGRQRVICNVHRQSGFFGNQAVDPPKESTPTCYHDAPVNQIS